MQESTENSKKGLADAEAALEALLSKAASDDEELGEARCVHTRAVSIGFHVVGGRRYMGSCFVLCLWLLFGDCSVSPWSPQGD